MAVPGSGYDPVIKGNNWGSPNNEVDKIIALANASKRDMTDVQNQINNLTIGAANGNIAVYPVVASGTNDYTVTFSGITGYFNGLYLNLLGCNANTGECSINLNGLGAVDFLIAVDATGREFSPDEISQVVQGAVYYNGDFYAVDSSAKNAKSNKNLLINGNFDVWQRGTSYTGASTYLADRWIITASTGSITQTRQATVGTEPFNALYFIRALTSGGFSSFIQFVEDAGKFLKGKKCTLSFYVKADKAVSASALLRNNTQALNYQGINYSITTDWNKVTLTFNPQTGWAQSDVLALYIFSYISDPTAVLDFAQIKLEVGDICTEFIFKTYAEELRDCQRYYYRPHALVSASYFGIGSADSTTTAQIGIEFPVQMRITPTLIATASELRLSDAVSSVVCSDAALNTFTSTRDRAIVNLTVASGLTQYRPYRLLGQIVQPNFAFNAEL